MASPQENDKLEGASSLTGLFQAPSEEEQPEKRPSDGAAVLSSLFQPREPPKDTNGRPTHQREGSASLVGLFSPPSVESAEDVLGESTATIQHSNHEESSDGEAEENHDTKLQRLFHQSGRETPIDEDEPLTEETPLMTNYYVPFDSPGKSPRARDEDNTPKTTSRGGRKRHQSTTSQLPSIREMNQGIVSKDTLVGSNGSATPKKSWKERIVGAGRTICHELSQPTTWIGAFMYLLFQIVFALTMGAAITRPHGTRSMLGLFAKMAALGIMFGASNYWVGLSHEIPAMYPTVDLFTAPFMANIAAIVDEEIFHDPTITDPDEGDQIFLATFTTLASISMIISGSLLVFASVFKLANLGAFLPFPVICGFFAAVGVLTWSLGFKIDTGKGIGEVLFSGDAELVLRSFIHHLPSVIIAAIMKYLGPKNPFYVVAVVLATIASFWAYIFMFSSLEEMIEAGWFWSSSDLLYQSKSQIGFASWAPPAPLGWINGLMSGKVMWSAVWKGLDTTVALAFLYLIRCSIHGAAMKKNVRNLQRKARKESTVSPVPSPGRRQIQHRRKFSEALDIENLTAAFASGVPAERLEKAKPTTLSLKDILIQYGFSQFICAAVGSFPVTPSVAASSTMFVLGAEAVAPQVGSVVLLTVFYLTDFQLVSIIPKAAFASLLVLAFIDMIITWFIKSYFKTKEKLEWLVVPLIVILAFAVGLLQAVFLGLAMSTFLFVATFFRSGIVKYVANGVTVRSTIERPLKDAKRLDQTGDAIQIMVLQNYLFFGNASSIQSYIISMFEEPPEDVDPIFLPPLPEVVIIDLTLVTGMDTSAVDAFSDILSQCQNFNCKLFLSGVSPSLRQVMFLGGMKPESTAIRSERKLRFFSGLDAAIGKAEDLILDDDVNSLATSFRHIKESGFLKALRQIDEQHEETTAFKDLADLEKHIEVFELDPEDTLYESCHCDRGLFFIEEGLMKIERSSGMTTTRGGSEAFTRLTNNGTLNDLKARTGSIGRATAAIKMGDHAPEQAHNFRIARVGPGWVIGSIEALSGLMTNASTIAVTKCRLHFISFNNIESLEENNPRLVLKLYKLLSYLMAKRQEVTIGQLGTLHSIMSAPALKKPIGRSRSNHLVHVSSFYE